MERIGARSPSSSPVLRIAAVAALQVLTLVLLIARDVAGEEITSCRADAAYRTRAPIPAVVALDGRTGAI
jgi:hypothetical protein